MEASARRAGRSPLDAIDVEPAIAVVVQHRQATADRLGEESAVGLAVVEAENQAGRRGIVNEPIGRSIAIDRGRRQPIDDGPAEIGQPVGERRRSRRSRVLVRRREFAGRGPGWRGRWPRPDRAEPASAATSQPRASKSRPRCRQSPASSAAFGVGSAASISSRRGGCPDPARTYGGGAFGRGGLAGLEQQDSQPIERRGVARVVAEQGFSSRRSRDASPDCPASQARSVPTESGSAGRCAAASRTPGTRPPIVRSTAGHARPTGRTGAAPAGDRAKRRPGRGGR